MDSTEPNRRQQILDAALRVFDRDGFHKASIKAIAREAHLKSPALIYWYFESKEELFQSALVQLSPLLKQSVDPAALMQLPPEEALPIIARMYLGTFDNPNVIRLLRISLTEGARGDGVDNRFIQNGILMEFNVVAQYLQRQMDVGALRSQDAQNCARMFLAVLVTYVVSREIFPALSAGLPDAESYVRQAVAVFLHGLRA